MADERPTLDALLQQLAASDQLTVADLHGAQAWARDNLNKPRTPWFVHPFIFLGALLGAAAITIGIAALLFDRYERTHVIIMGVAYLILALVLHRVRRNDFTDYLALSFSIGGHVFLMIGVAEAVRPGYPEMVVFAVATASSVLLYGLFRDFLHRFLSCLLVLVTAKVAFPAEDIPDVLHAFVAAAACICAALIAQDRQRPTWRPLAYACGCGIPVILLPLSERGLWFEDPELPHAWISSVVIGLALLLALRFAATRLDVRPATPTVAVVILAVAGLSALAAPGILAGLFLIVLGYAAHHWQLVFVGLITLPIYVFKDYYNLDVDFLTKSGVLASSGILLLAARWIFVRSRLYAALEDQA